MTTSIISTTSTLSVSQDINISPVYGKFDDLAQFAFRAHANLIRARKGYPNGGGLHTTRDILDTFNAITDALTLGVASNDQKLCVVGLGYSRAFLIEQVKQKTQIYSSYTTNIRLAAGIVGSAIKIMQLHIFRENMLANYDFLA